MCLSLSCFSVLLQAVVLAPVDLIKVRLQNQTHPHSRRGLPLEAQPRYKGPLHCAASILREEGIPGLFRGVRALLMRDTPTMSAYFLTYTGICRGMTTEGQEPGEWLMGQDGGGQRNWMDFLPLVICDSVLNITVLVPHQMSFGTGPWRARRYMEEGDR